MKDPKTVILIWSAYIIYIAVVGGMAVFLIFDKGYLTR